MKSRSSYLPLLELAIKENPENDRNMHYLGREYMYYGKYEEAITTLEKHLNLKSATWKDERCASMRFIARTYMKINRPKEALMWANMAIKESHYLRDPYMEKALITYELKNYKETEKLCLEALKIKKHPKTYINEVISQEETLNENFQLLQQKFTGDERLLKILSKGIAKEKEIREIADLYISNYNL